MKCVICNNPMDIKFNTVIIDNEFLWQKFYRCNICDVSTKPIDCAKPSLEKLLPKINFNKMVEGLSIGSDAIVSASMWMKSAPDSNWKHINFNTAGNIHEKKTIKDQKRIRPTIF